MQSRGRNAATNDRKAERRHAGQGWNVAMPGGLHGRRERNGKTHGLGGPPPAAGNGRNWAGVRNGEKWNGHNSAIPEWRYYGLAAPQRLLQGSCKVQQDFVSKARRCVRTTGPAVSGFQGE